MWDLNGTGGDEKKNITGQKPKYIMLQLIKSPAKCVQTNSVDIKGLFAWFWYQCQFCTVYTSITNIPKQSNNPLDSCKGK